MLRHIALFTWKPGATEQDREQAMRALQDFLADFPGVSEFAVRPDAGLDRGAAAVTLSDATADLAVVVDFVDRDAYVRYADDPAHQSLLDRYVRPVMSSRDGAQFEL